MVDTKEGILPLNKEELHDLSMPQRRNDATARKSAVKGLLLVAGLLLIIKTTAWGLGVHDGKESTSLSQVKGHDTSHGYLAGTLAKGSRWSISGGGHNGKHGKYDKHGKHDHDHDHKHKHKHDKHGKGDKHRRPGIINPKEAEEIFLSVPNNDSVRA